MEYASRNMLYDHMYISGYISVDMSITSGEKLHSLTSHPGLLTNQQNSQGCLLRLQAGQIILRLARTFCSDSM